VDGQCPDCGMWIGVDIADHVCPDSGSYDELRKHISRTFLSLMKTSGVPKDVLNFMRIAALEKAKKEYGVVKSVRDRGMTVRDARRLVYKEMFSKGGIQCPVCDKNAIVAKRSMVSSAVKALLRLVVLYKHNKNFYSLSEINVVSSDRGGGNFSALKHWGMIEKMENTDSSKRSSGYYKPTEKGIAFASNEIPVLKYVRVYNDAVRDREGPSIFVVDAVGQDFDYAKYKSDNY